MFILTLIYQKLSDKFPPRKHSKFSVKNWICVKFQRKCWSDFASKFSVSDFVVCFLLLPHKHLDVHCSNIGFDRRTSKHFAQGQWKNVSSFKHLLWCRFQRNNNELIKQQTLIYTEITRGLPWRRKTIRHRFLPNNFFRWRQQSIGFVLLLTSRENIFNSM